MTKRESNLVKIVGEEAYKKLRNTKCLLVGAGGIGSELLKDLVLMEFGEIHVVDLDTIDLSNLNRQFLFRQRDIKQPKATTAIRAVELFSNSKLVPYQDNIMDTKQFPLHWFGQFDIIFNALDNLAARRYVNKMSQFLRIPLLESGTAGFDGYIQPIIPGKTECFDCTKKETPKTFPVCTIRSTPSQPIHCIVWAKNFLFNQLFASSVKDLESEEQDNESSKDWGTDDIEEINRIKQETNELKELQNIIIKGDKSNIKDIIKKLFIQDIEKLLLIDNLWKTRTKPKPIAHDTYKETTLKKDLGHLNLNQIWDINIQIIKFAQITAKLMDRYHRELSIEFDKDDQDTLEFVATAANIRSHIFSIPMKTVFDIKQIAGNIIPAIATTNAIIAGLSSLMSLRVLNLLKYAPVDKPTDINMAFTAKASNLSQNRYLSNLKLAPPNCNCAVCSKVIRGVVKLSHTALKNNTFGKFITEVKRKSGLSDDISMIDTNTQRLLYDYDFEDLESKFLSELGLQNGSILLITDEEEKDGLSKQFLELYLDISDSENISMQIPKVVPEFKFPLETNRDTSNEEIETGSISGVENQANNIVIIDEEENLNDKKRPLENNDSELARKKPKESVVDDEITILD
ncbi:E1 ubiquitin-activating protein UBA2 [Nakaseomyces bracarensis]|uniref:E1 ubiquitin-activating protein UBA2 n=1 Tax=Nakaseomyces bracarensis TaxID=273131 RepID=UPI0038725BFF